MLIMMLQLLRRIFSRSETPNQRDSVEARWPGKKAGVCEHVGGSIFFP
jgi:hypothetical protein